MIYTSSHENWQSDKYRTYAISGNRGKNCNYRGKCYPKLAPKLSFWKIWHDNLGIIPKEENTKYYIQEYYKQVLSKLDPEKVYRELDNSVLLCYESNEEFCHRHIVSAWLELLLGIEVKEAKANEYEIEVTTRPEYIKEYLEEVMKKDKNMRGFHSLRALYLFEKGEKLEELANKLEKEEKKSYNEYRQMACFYRCNADEIEESYGKSRLVKQKKQLNISKKSF